MPWQLFAMHSVQIGNAAACVLGAPTDDCPCISTHNLEFHHRLPYSQPVEIRGIFRCQSGFGHPLMKGACRPMNVTSLTFLALCLPFLGALAAPMLTRMFGHGAAWVLALIPAAIFVHFSGFAAKVSQGRAVAGGYSWVPSLDVRLSFLVDGLSLTFLLLISGIGALIVLLCRWLPQGPSASGPLPLVPPDVHGRDAWPGRLRQLPDAVRLLGADLDHLLPSDRF